jgi:hypothetical protein
MFSSIFQIKRFIGSYSLREAIFAKALAKLTGCPEPHVQDCNDIGLSRCVFIVICKVEKTVISQVGTGFAKN